LGLGGLGLRCLGLGGLGLSGVGFGCLGIGGLGEPRRKRCSTGRRLLD
jgi:hypothetical protein